MSRIVLYFSLFVAILPVRAKCDNFSLLGVDNLSKPSASDTTYVAKSALGAGLFFEKTFSEEFAAELGVMSVSRRYQNSAATQEYTQKMIEIPAIFRIYLGENIALGLGGYYSFFTGGYKTQDFTNGTTYTTPYALAYLSSIDYGALASLAFFQTLFRNFKLVLEVRDTVGINNNRTNTSFPKLHVNDVQALLGLRMDL